MDLISKKYNIDINIQGIGSIFHLSFTNNKKLYNYADYLETNIEKLQYFVKIMSTFFLQYKNNVQYASDSLAALLTASDEIFGLERDVR